MNTRSFSILVAASFVLTTGCKPRRSSSGLRGDGDAASDRLCRSNNAYLDGISDVTPKNTNVILDKYSDIAKVEPFLQAIRSDQKTFGEIGGEDGIKSSTIFFAERTRLNDEIAAGFFSKKKLFVVAQKSNGTSSVQSFPINEQEAPTQITMDPKGNFGLMAFGKKIYPFRFSVSFDLKRKSNWDLFNNLSNKNPSYSAFADKAIESYAEPKRYMIVDHDLSTFTKEGYEQYQMSAGYQPGTTNTLPDVVGGPLDMIAPRVYAQINDRGGSANENGGTVLQTFDTWKRKINLKMLNYQEFSAPGIIAAAQVRYRATTDDSQKISDFDSASTTVLLTQGCLDLDRRCRRSLKIFDTTIKFDFTKKNPVASTERSGLRIPSVFHDISAIEGEQTIAYDSTVAISDDLTSIAIADISQTSGNPSYVHVLNLQDSMCLNIVRQKWKTPKDQNDPRNPDLRDCYNRNRTYKFNASDLDVNFIGNKLLIRYGTVDRTDESLPKTRYLLADTDYVSPRLIWDYSTGEINESKNPTSTGKGNVYLDFLANCKIASGGSGAILKSWNLAEFDGSRVLKSNDLAIDSNSDIVGIENLWKTKPTTSARTNPGTSEVELVTYSKNGDVNILTEAKSGETKVVPGNAFKPSGVKESDISSGKMQTQNASVLDSIGGGGREATSGFVLSAPDGTFVYTPKSALAADAQASQRVFPNADQVEQLPKNLKFDLIVPWLPSLKEGQIGFLGFKSKQLTPGIVAQEAPGALTAWKIDSSGQADLAFQASMDAIGGSRISGGLLHFNPRNPKQRNLVAINERGSLIYFITPQGSTSVPSFFPSVEKIRDFAKFDNEVTPMLLFTMRNPVHSTFILNRPDKAGEERDPNFTTMLAVANNRDILIFNPALLVRNMRDAAKAPMDQKIQETLIAAQLVLDLAPNPMSNQMQELISTSFDNLVSANFNAVLPMFRSTSFKKKLTVPGNGHITQLAISPDHQLLAAGTSDGKVVLFVLADTLAADF